MMRRQKDKKQESNVRFPDKILGMRLMKIKSIPADWCTVRIKDIAEINKKNLPNNTRGSYQFQYVDLSAVKEGQVDVPDARILFQNAPSRARRVISKGDVLMSTVRPYLRGFAVVAFNAEDVICSTGFAIITPKVRSDSEFIHQSLYATTTERQLYRLLVGSNYPAINNIDVEHLWLTYPLSEKERFHIATLLVTWDKAIEKTIGLIQAKTAFKQALMQQLLTGKLRFKEFKGQRWKVFKLDHFFKEYTERNIGNDHLTILSCTKTNGIVAQEERFGKRLASENLTRYKIVRKGNLIYDPMLLWDASIGFLKRYDAGVVSPAYFTFHFDESKGDRNFFEHVLNSHYMCQMYKIISQGTNVRRRKAPKEAFLNIEIKLPPSIDEQRRIAAVLNGIDKEIELLEKKLEHLKKQKKGLMQKLLTGEIRVKV